MFLSALSSELCAQNVFFKRELNSFIIANKDKTINIPKGFFTEIEVNKKNSVELKNNHTMCGGGGSIVVLWCGGGGGVVVVVRGGEEESTVSQS